MTFIDSDDDLSFSLNSKDKIKGFKCTEKHFSGQSHKYRYFCVDCSKNVCSECIVHHTTSKIQRHYIITLDLNKSYDYQRVKLINKIINEKEKENKTENNESKDYSNSNDDKIIPTEEAKDKIDNTKNNKIIIFEDTAKLIKCENDDKFDYFAEFINIIINDFLNFPNYFHSYNIKNIYNFCLNKNIFEAKIKYLNKPNQKIRLFGYQFVYDNKKNLSIIIDESIEYIKEFHIFNPKKTIVEIYLTDKKKDKSYQNIDKMDKLIRCMFENCESLIEVEFNFNGYKINKDLSHLFDGCKSLLKVPECVIGWVNNDCCDISYMFSNCSFLKELPDISKWKTSEIHKMLGVFKGCKSLKYLPDISGWDTGNVENMSFMFSDCTNLKELSIISDWNTGGVISMINMFSNCSNLTSIPNLKKWDTRNLNDIRGMFKNCISITDLDFLSEWKLNKIDILNMSQLFYGCSKLKRPNLQNWNIDKRKSNNTKEMFKLIISEEKNIININNNNIKKFNFKTLNPGDIIYIETELFEGKTIFHLLSYMIFNDVKYHEEINKIYEKNIKSSVNTTENDKVNYYILIFNYFSSIFKIKFILLRKELIQKNENKDNFIVDDIFGKENGGNFVVIFNENEDGNKNISFSTFKFNIGGLSEKKIKEIQNIIFEMKKNLEEKDKNKANELISTKIKKEIKIFKVLSCENRIPYSIDYYYRVIISNEKLENPVKYDNIFACSKISDIIKDFSSVEKKEKINIINKYQNIIFDEVIINNKKTAINTKNYKEILNINDELEKIKFCICYFCSGYNKENKELYKVCNNFVELKNHCNNYHNSQLNNCIINFNFNEKYVEIEPINLKRYIIKLDDMIDSDKEYLLKNKDK